MPKPPLPPIDGRFRQVTDVAWDTAGNIYISDGYINSRVAKVDKNGNWVKSWGEPRQRSPASSTRRTASRPTRKGNVYVADRGNRRIQVFDGDGKFLRQITIDVPLPPDAQPAIGANPRATSNRLAATMAPGAPWAICITPRTEPGAVQRRRVSRAASTS